MTPALLLWVALILAEFGLLEAFFRSRKAAPEVSRRVTHVIATLMAIAAHVGLPGASFVYLMVIFIVLIVLSHVFNILKHIHGVTRKTWGEEFLVLGFLFAHLLSAGDATIFAAAALVLGLADPTAGMIIDRYRGHTPAFVGFFVVSLLILFFMMNAAPFWVLVGTAIAAGIVERVSPYGSDNVTIPVVVVLLLTILL